MNRDVKIGLAVGLLLLVGLFVWIAVKSGENIEPLEPVADGGALAPAVTETGRVTLPTGGSPVGEFFPEESGASDEIASITVGSDSIMPPIDDLTEEGRSYARDYMERRRALEADSTSPVIAPGIVVSVPSSYVVKSGDSLSAISQAVYGTSRHWKLIARENQIEDPTRLRPGMVLRVPPRPQSDPGTSVVVNVVESPGSGEAQMHRVEMGDALSTISERYYGSARYVGRIMEANNLSEYSILQVGHVLRIPALGRASSDLPGSTLSATGQRYEVQEGDTLSSISQQFYGTARLHMLIMRENGIHDPMRLRAGQKITIPPKPTQADSVPSPIRELEEPSLDPGERQYVVQEGDTLSEIASRELGSVRYISDLKKRNNINDENVLGAGDILVIPSRTRLEFLSGVTAE